MLIEKVISLIFKIYYFYKNIKIFLIFKKKKLLKFNSKKKIRILEYRKDISKGYYLKAIQKFKTIILNKKVDDFFSIKLPKDNFIDLSSKKILIIGGADHIIKFQKKKSFDYVIFINQISNEIRNKLLNSNFILCLNGNAVKRFVTNSRKISTETNIFFVKTEGDKRLLEKYFSLLNKQIKCFLLPKSFNCVTYGSLDFSSLVLMYVKSLKPSVIELKGIDLFTTKGRRKGYASSHQIKNKNDNYEQRVNVSFSREHCPYSIFLNMKKILSSKNIKIDNKLFNIINKDLFYYSRKLNSLYGKKKNK